MLILFCTFTFEIGLYFEIDMKDRYFLIILFLAILVYGANFWGTSIYILDEAKNAGCAMEMYERGDFIVPTFNSILRTDKPPLHYFFMILAYKAFGINPFAARIFSVLAGLLTVIVVYLFTGKLMGRKTAFFSSLIMVSSLQLAIQFHLAVPDPYLILFMTILFFLFYLGYEKDSEKYLLGFYGVTGLAFLSKGLIAIVIPGLVIFLFILLTRQLNKRGIIKLHLFWGSVVFLIISAPWYIAVGYKTDGLWLEGFFITHNVQRFTSTMEGHSGFPFAPFGIMIVALLPFSIFLIQAIKVIWCQRKQNNFFIFCLIIITVIPLFFTFSKTILPSYPAPAFPFFAIILGYYLESVLKTQPIKTINGLLMTLILYVFISAFIPIGVYLTLHSETVFYHLDYFAYPFFILPIGGVMAAYFYYCNKKKLMIYSLAGSWIFTGLFFFYYLYPQIDKLNPVTRSIQVLDLKKYPVVFYGSFNPAFVFALQKQIPRLNTPEDVMHFFKKNPHGYLITYQKYYPDLKDIHAIEIKFEQKDLFESAVTVLLQRKMDSGFSGRELKNYIE